MTGRGGLSVDGLRTLLGWLAIALLAVPVGGALWLGVAYGESPCILCWAQRTSMVLIALTALFVVRYGPRPRYVGVLVLLGAWGTYMGIRHSALHLARDVGQGFAMPILGVHTYVWAWFIHFVVLVAAGAVLLVVRGPLGDDAARPGRVPFAGRFAMGLLVVLAGLNAVQAFVSTGPPPFLGQGDPVRLSLDPRNWVWAMGELEGGVSLRGRWTIPVPEPADVEVDADPANGPLAGLTALPVTRWETIAAGLDGTPVAFAAAPGGAAASGGGRPAFVVVTDRHGVYLLDAGLSTVLHGVRLDPGFSIDLSELAGAAFLGGDTVAVASINKSYVLLRPDPGADPAREWRHFLETDGTVTELRRSRFATLRARQQYVLSLAYDATADELITVSVPSAHHPRLTVSRFDRSDLTLSSEFHPVPGPSVRVRDGRSLGEFVVTGAAAADGRLYAFSAASSTVLVIDLATGTVVSAHAVPGVPQSVGLAVRGDELWLATTGGRVAVVPRP